MAQYKRCSFIRLDVWGNCEDGWTVNDLRTVLENIPILPGTSDAGILTLLNILRLIPSCDPNVMYIEGYEDTKELGIFFCEHDEPYGLIRFN